MIIRGHVEPNVGATSWVRDESAEGLVKELNGAVGFYAIRSLGVVQHHSYLMLDPI